MPDVSVAVASRVCMQSATVVVSQSVSYGSVESVPMVLPLTLNSTSEIAKSSEALAIIVTLSDKISDSVGAVIVTVGGITVGQIDFEISTDHREIVKARAQHIYSRAIGTDPLAGYVLALIPATVTSRERIAKESLGVVNSPPWAPRFGCFVYAKLI